MKILQLIHKPQNRGAETFACQLSHHLLQFGHEVKIVAIYSGEANLPFSPNIETLNGCVNKKVLDINAWRKLSEIIHRFAPDIVQANSGDTLKYAVFSKVIFRWKVPLVVRNASEVGRYLNSFFQKRVNKFFYKRVERIISVSRASEADLIQHFPFLIGKTEVIGVGIEKAEIETVHLLTSNKKHVVHVGGFSFEKNHSGLLRIFQKIQIKNRDVQLHLVGDGPLKSNIVAEAEELHLLEHITFHGFVNNPLSYIKAGDVLVLPSAIEGLPGVILEAMYCRTPVVAYDVGGISEIVNSRTGRMVDKGNEDKFAEEVLQLLQKQDDERVERAHKMVTENFLNEKLAREFIRSYKALVLAKFK